MRQGPVEPGSIQELIVTLYWMQQREAEAAKSLAMIHATAGTDKTEELVREYVEAFMPYAFGVSKDKSEDMEGTLNKWVESGAISIPREAVSDDSLYNGNRAVKKFAKMKERGSEVARRRSPLSGRNRSPTG